MFGRRKRVAVVERRKRDAGRGTRLFAWRTNGTAAGIALAAFDDRHAFAPTEHIWLSAKMDWVNLNDGLPQYQEGPPLS